MNNVINLGIIPSNHGKLWTKFDLETFSLLYKDGRSINEMCETLGRTKNSIIAALERLTKLSNP